MANHGSRARGDLLIALFLFAAAVVYLASLPWNLGAADESFFLYEAKRIREGEVMYRDFFQFVTPGAWYFMALLYSIFGTSMATARISAAVLHGATVLVLYASCRRIDVRRELAVVVALAYVALCPPVWPYASPHWYSTFLVALLLLVAIPGAWSERAGASFALGALAGVLIMVQQQKGVITAAGIAALLVADAGLRRLLSARRGIRLTVQLLSLAAGVSCIVGPSLLAMVAAAGWQPVFDDLVTFPLFEYPGRAPTTRWGTIGFLPRLLAPNTWPWFLRLLPFLAVPAVLRLAVALALGRKRLGERALDGARLQLVFIAYLLTSAASVLYNPDLVHLAFIAPVGMVALAEISEWALGWPRPRLASSLAGWVVVLLALVPLSRQIAGNTTRLRSSYPYGHETAFGRVDFARRWEPVFVDKLREALDRTASRELFCYPAAVSPYLTAGGRNPTPFQFLAPLLSPPRQIEQAASILRKAGTPYIVAAPLFLKADDPVAQLIDERYELVNMPELFLSGEFPELWLYTRSDDGGGAP